MDAQTNCPECGSELESNQISGLCPKCMMRKGMESQRNETLPIDPDGSASGTEEPIAEAPGRYTLIGEHARGGMGRVLIVHDESIGRDIALKELLPEFADNGGETPLPVRHSKEMAARFLREAKITGQLEHPAITPVHELGRRPDGSLYYTMKLVRGRTLEAAIRESKSYEERLKLLPHFVDLCHAISYAHSRGVIHRDIKPSNVMVGDFGETVVVDWGLAKVKQAAGETAPAPGAEAKTVVAVKPDSKKLVAKTKYGEVMGTPVYMSPEQARGQLDKIDEGSDVYSLGAVLYQILTGRVPFDGNSVEEIVNKAVHETPEPVRSIERKVSRELARICERAMARDRGERIQSATILAKQAERASGVPDIFINPFRPLLVDLVPELRTVPLQIKTAIVSEAKKRWRRKNLWRSVLQDTGITAALIVMFGVLLLALDAAMDLQAESAPFADAVFALVMLFDYGGILLAGILVSKAHRRSIEPYVREVLLEWEVLKKLAGDPAMGQDKKRCSTLLKIGAWGIVGAAVGYGLGLLDRSANSLNPGIASMVAAIIGAQLAVTISAIVYFMLTNRRIRTEFRAGTHAQK